MRKEVIILCLLTFIISIFSLNFVSGEVQSLPQPVKTGECINLPQIHANITYSNISTIQTPSSLLTINSQQTNLGQGYFNYTFCNTSSNGLYIINGIADPDGIPTAWNYEIIVNPLGKVFTTSQAVLYILVFIIAFTLFMLCVIGATSISSDNKRDQMTGYILAVDNMKYVKMFLWAISYLLVLLIS